MVGSFFRYRSTLSFFCLRDIVIWFYFGVELFYVFCFFCFTSFVPRYSQKEPSGSIISRILELRNFAPFRNSSNASYSRHDIRLTTTTTAYRSYVLFNLWQNSKMLLCFDMAGKTSLPNELGLFVHRIFCGFQVCFCYLSGG